jgi:hypothetical protein
MTSCKRWRCNLLSFAGKLFRHLIGECERCLRHNEAEHLGGLEVNDRLNASGPLHRQVSGFLPFENAARISAGNANRLGRLLCGLA